MTLHERTAENGTFHVEIVCNFETEVLTVEVTDRYGEWILYPLTGKEAIDMFYHPYAYSAGILRARSIPTGQEVTA